MYELRQTAARFVIGSSDEQGFIGLYSTADRAVADCALAILNDTACVTGSRREMGEAWLRHCREHGQALKVMRPFLDFMPRIQVPRSEWQRG